MRSMTLLLLALLTGLQYRIWIADGGVSHTLRVKQQLADDQEQIAKMKARNAALEAEVADLQSGSDALEARARGMLGMIKDGETFFLIVSR